MNRPSICQTTDEFPTANLCYCSLENTCAVYMSLETVAFYSIFSNPNSFQVKQQNCISLWTKTLPKAFLVARKRWSLEPTCTSNIHWLTYYQQMLWIHCLHQHQWQLPAKSQGQPLVWRNSLKKIKEKSIIYCTWACKSEIHIDYQVWNLEHLRWMSTAVTHFPFTLSHFSTTI